MLSKDFSTNCAPSLIQNTDILITLRVPKTKDLSAQSLAINMENRFPYHIF